jgi:hypothetical protein
MRLEIRVCGGVNPDNVIRTPLIIIGSEAIVTV